MFYQIRAAYSYTGERSLILKVTFAESIQRSFRAVFFSPYFEYGLAQNRYVLQYGVLVHK